MRRELGHVRAPLAQRRHPQHVDVEPVEQVLAEPLLLHFVLELAVRRRDDARVYGDRAGAAHASHLTLLEDAQQLRLRGRREVADRVEEQGAAARRLERPLAQRHGAREGAALVAEQLALHEVVGEGRAVKAMKGPAGRPPSRCRSLATSSLPAPLSPTIRIGLGIGATRAIRSRSFCMAGLDPKSVASWPRSRRSSTTCCSSRRRASACAISCTTRSIGSAWSMKPCAPSRTAWMQRPQLPVPVHTVTGTCTARRPLPRTTSK